ncbi:MAG: uroporphyrinogen-III C-methyltransferase [Tannerellaceae bacterium]|jgi:uroporphyrinogen III methyltransferase/synthase|nr:uroporphyrinogen-III C-methyltransferase [Tannerellaceae bacterium]
MRLQVISRKSRLSLIQVKEAMALFPSLTEDYELITLDTFGDKHRDISLMDPSVPEDFFTRELDEFLLNGKADIAVHSAKDLPYPLTPGLAVVALLPARDRSDALVSRNGQRLDQLPAKTRIGTSSSKRKRELIAQRNDVEVVPIRGNIEERLALVDNGFIDALIVATCALQRLGLDGRIAHILPFETHPLQGHLAIVARQDRNDLAALFAEQDCRRHYGRVTLVGFGPGDPDLLTIKGEKALTEAEVIFHDDLVDQDFLNQYSAEKIYVGKRRFIHRFRQEEINEQVYVEAVKGRKVVRLKGGDPMLFAHGREEIDYLQSRLIAVTVIPGISSAIAMASATHIPLTHRGTASSVAFVTGHSAESLTTPSADTLVYFMPAAALADIAKALIEDGRPANTPAVLVHAISLGSERKIYATLEELRYSVMVESTPLLLVVGKVVEFEHHLRKLQGVLLTGIYKEDYPQYSHAIHTPLIHIQTIHPTSSSVLQMLGTLQESFDRIIFTSRHAVHHFFRICRVLLPADIRIATVGSTTTAALHEYGFTPDIESPTQTAGGLIKLLTPPAVKLQRILLPRSSQGLPTLPTALTTLGHTVKEVPLYDTVLNPDAHPIDLRPFHKIIFTSPSGVNAFLTLYHALPPLTLLIARGPVTLTYLRKSASRLADSYAAGGLADTD